MQPIKFQLRGDTPIEILRELCDIHREMSDEINKDAHSKSDNSESNNGGWFIYAGHQTCKLNYYTVYYYKKEGFDDAYKAMNKVLPNITEDAFAKFLHDDCSNGGYNPELIFQSDVKIKGYDSHLFKMVNREWYEWGQPDYFSCSAKVSNLENRELLNKLLFVASPYLVI